MTLPPLHPMAQNAIHIIQLYLPNPFVLLAMFVAASALMIWRLQAIENKGFEGTVLGTLIMPYCSGFANLAFAYVMSNTGSNGGMVLENCIVNNATNLTLILGMAAAFGGAAVMQPAKKQDRTHRINKLNLLFTLIALFLFTGTLWALAKDGILDFYDGLVLVGLFVFWQILHVFEILKNNIRQNQAFHWSIVIDLLLIGASAYGIYFAVNHLVDWVSTAQSPYFSFTHLGWLSGALMVLPNAFIALYYSHICRQDIVVSSQIGDGHICIPMCIGLFTLFNPIKVPAFFQTGVYVILGAGVVLALAIAAIGRIPRMLGYGLIGGYAFFLYKGIIQ